jgi:hypothetical protein
MGMVVHACHPRYVGRINGKIFPDKGETLLEKKQTGLLALLKW